MATIPAVKRLSSRIIRILGCNPGPMTMQGTNTYLVGTGHKRILIDAGDRGVPEYLHNLNEVIKSENAVIEHVIITHWHHDHLGGVVDLIKGLTGPMIWKHQRSPDDDKDEPLPNGIDLHWLLNDQELAIEGATIKIYHTPGHTTDHVCVMLKEENVIFSGDCILGDSSTVFEDLQSYMKSLEKLLKLMPCLIYPGHGNIVKDPSKRIREYIEHRQNREKVIMDTLKKNCNTALTEMDLVQLIYTDTPEHLWNAAAYNVNHHLMKLFKEKKIEMLDDGGTRKWRYTTMDCSL